MVSDVVMPKLGLSMTEGAVTSWMKDVGSWVDQGEALFTVQTDKVEMEVESTTAGYLTDVLVGVGQTVPVGTVIAKLSSQQVGS